MVKTALEKLQNERRQKLFLAPEVKSLFSSPVFVNGKATSSHKN